MKRFFSPLFLTGIALILLVSLPYWPPTFFSALVLVCLMGVLVLRVSAAFFPSRKNSQAPLLSVEELADLEELEEELADSEERKGVEVPRPIVNAVRSLQAKKQAQNRAKNKKKKRRTRKRLSKKSRQNNRKK
ncbi:MAG: hypothetical protein ACRBFS_21680 [Aureispira sp.]